LTPSDGCRKALGSGGSGEEAWTARSAARSKLLIPEERTIWLDDPPAALDPVERLDARTDRGRASARDLGEHLVDVVAVGEVGSRRSPPAPIEAAGDPSALPWTSGCRGVGAACEGRPQARFSASPVFWPSGREPEALSGSDPASAPSRP
jgi:hypothetical protein